MTRAQNLSIISTCFSPGWACMEVRFAFFFSITLFISVASAMAFYIPRAFAQRQFNSIVCVCLCIGWSDHMLPSNRRFVWWTKKWLHFFLCASSFFFFSIFSFISKIDTHGTCHGRWMARYIATSCVFSGWRELSIARKHTRDWYWTIYSYQTRDDNTAKDFCYFARPIRGKPTHTMTIQFSFRFSMFDRDVSNRNGSFSQIIKFV